MKTRNNEIPFYYTATVLREGTPVLRQGTINALDVSAAMAKVEIMVINDWKRPLKRIEIYSIQPSGEANLEMTSHFGSDDPAFKLVDRNPQHGTMCPVGPRQSTPTTSWYPTSIGTSFTPENFGILRTYGR